MSNVITTMNSYVKLKYNEAESTETVTELLEEMSYTDFASGSTDSLSVSLYNKDGIWFRKDFFPGKNDWLEAWIFTENWPIAPANGKIKCGRFQIDEVSFSGYGERVTIGALAIPQNSAFSFSQKNRTWKKTTVRTILDTLAKKASLGVEWVSGTPDPKIAEISQSGSTDLEFAFSICSQYDLSLKVYQKKLVVYDQTIFEKKKPAFTINRKELMGSYNLSTGTNSRYDCVKMQYTNGKDEKTLTYSFKVPGVSGSRTLFISSDADSVADAERKAKAQLRQSLRENTKLSISDTLGGSRYAAGKVFKLEGFGQLSGNYCIDQVTHTKGSSKYRCDIEAHKVVTSF